MSSEGFENLVRQPILPHELPDIFLAVEFGRAWRELQERDVAWNLEGLGAITMQFRLFRWIRFRLAGPMLNLYVAIRQIGASDWVGYHFSQKKAIFLLAFATRARIHKTGVGGFASKKSHVATRRRDVTACCCISVPAWASMFASEIYLSDGSISPAFGQTPQWVPCFEFPTRI